MQSPPLPPLLPLTLSFTFLHHSLGLRIHKHARALTRAERFLLSPPPQGFAAGAKGGGAAGCVWGLCRAAFAVGSAINGFLAVESAVNNTENKGVDVGAMGVSLGLELVEFLVSGCEMAAIMNG